ncbi:MAG: DUF4340 domain-containing protein [Deltaproteobacteria bacterium]|nr:DUF4340 domain-containing protein [Deltaproteobacteria bacterium]
MSRRALVGLTLLAALLGLLLLLSPGSPKQRADRPLFWAMLQGKSVDRLLLRFADGRQLAVVHRGDVWVRERSSTTVEPIRTAPVERLLRTLAFVESLRTIDEARPEIYGLARPTVEVVVGAASAAELLRFSVGSADASGDAAYLRFAGQVHVVAGELRQLLVEFPELILSRRLIEDIARARRIVWRAPGADDTTLLLIEGRWVLEQGEGRVLADPQAVRKLIDALTDERIVGGIDTPPIGANTGPWLVVDGEKQRLLSLRWISGCAAPAQGLLVEGPSNGKARRVCLDGASAAALAALKQRASWIARRPSALRAWQVRGLRFASATGGAVEFRRTGLVWKRTDGALISEERIAQFLEAMRGQRGELVAVGEWRSLASVELRLEDGQRLKWRFARLPSGRLALSRSAETAALLLADSPQVEPFLDPASYRIERVANFEPIATQRLSLQGSGCDLAFERKDRRWFVGDVALGRDAEHTVDALIEELARLSGRPLGVASLDAPLRLVLTQQRRDLVRDRRIIDEITLLIALQRCQLRGKVGVVAVSPNSCQRLKRSLKSLCREIGR